jgi:hypothetical protein
VTNTEFPTQPLFTSFDAPKTIVFGAGDGTPADNYGGVSLRFTAVPEPATWTMMVLGFGGAGLMLRTRRRVAPVPVRVSAQR